MFFYGWYHCHLYCIFIVIFAGVIFKTYLIFLVLAFLIHVVYYFKILLIFFYLTLGPCCSIVVYPLVRYSQVQYIFYIKELFSVSIFFKVFHKAIQRKKYLLNSWYINNYSFTAVMLVPIMLVSWENFIKSFKIKCIIFLSEYRYMNKN